MQQTLVVSKKTVLLNYEQLRRAGDQVKLKYMLRLARNQDTWLAVVEYVRKITHKLSIHVDKAMLAECSVSTMKPYSPDEVKKLTSDLKALYDLHATKIEGL